MTRDIGHIVEIVGGIILGIVACGIVGVVVFVIGILMCILAAKYGKGHQGDWQQRSSGRRTPTDHDQEEEVKTELPRYQNAISSPPPAMFVVAGQANKEGQDVDSILAANIAAKNQIGWQQWRARRTLAVRQQEQQEGSQTGQSRYLSAITPPPSAVFVVVDQAHGGPQDVAPPMYAEKQPKTQASTSMPPSTASPASSPPDYQISQHSESSNSRRFLSRIRLWQPST